MTVLSMLLLMALYNIRLNHYKFLYGIYMTCGADFRKLFNTAVWELLVVSLMTFVPSILSLCNIGSKIAIRYAGTVTASFLSSPIHLNISKRHITETIATAIGNTQV